MCLSFNQTLLLMMRYYFLTLIYFFHLIQTQAQGENDNWIFGNGCNISFASGKPVVLPSVKTLLTKEGCTSVSDKDGKLLFYSDGISVWNADHSLMPNGYGLLGNPSSTSSCVIVPFPAHPGMYYIFCVEPNVLDFPRASYSIVDLKLNGGNGGLLVKNKILISSTDEKIAITRHCNGHDFWVVLHQAFSDTYLSYLLSANGLSSSSVQSKIKQSFGYKELGFLKFSPEGKYLADARCLGRKLLLHKFNNTTGKIVPYLNDDNTLMPDFTGQTFYGLAFSANSENLYATCLDEGFLFQYDLEQDSAKILPTRNLLYDFNRRIGAMQLAKDNKIYFTNGYGSPYLHAIGAPEKKGLHCELKLLALELPTSGQLGLPTYVEAPEKYFSLGKDNMIIQKGAELNAGILHAKYRWSTGDTSFSITVLKSGKYWVDVFTQGNCFLLTDTIEILVGYDGFKELNFSSKQFHLCDGDSIVFPAFKADTNFVEFNWLVNGVGTGLPSVGKGNLPVMRAQYIEQDDSVQISVFMKRLGIRGDTLHFVVYRYSKSGLKELPDVTVCENSRLIIDSIISIPRGRTIYWRHKEPAVNTTMSGDGQIPAFWLPDVAHTLKDTFTVSVTQAYCPEQTRRFELNVVNKVYEEDLFKQQCSGDSLKGGILLPHVSPGKVKWLKNMASFMIDDSGRAVFPDVFLPRSTKNSLSKFSVIIGSDYCGNDTIDLRIMAKERPTIERLLSDTIELCGGNQVPFPKIVTVPSSTDIKWKTDNVYAGLTSEGKGSFPAVIAIKDSVDHYTKIFVNSNSGTCSGDSLSFWVHSKRVPETLDMPNLLYCENEAVPGIRFRKQNSADQVVWSVHGPMPWPYQSTDVDVVPAFKISGIENITTFSFFYHAEFNGCAGIEREFDCRVMPRPEVGFYYDSFLQVQDVQLINLGRKYHQIKWYFGDGDSSTEHQPMHHFNVSRPYKVTQILDNQYCSDTLTKVVLINQATFNHIPSAFSPDQNDVNEGFKIFNPSGNVTFAIFNAWGELLYMTEANMAWDGTYKGLPCQQGVYLYMAEVSDRTGDIKQFRGSITLLR